MMDDFEKGCYVGLAFASCIMLIVGYVFLYLIARFDWIATAFSLLFLAVTKLALASREKEKEQ